MFRIMKTRVGLRLTHRLLLAIVPALAVLLVSAGSPAGAQTASLIAQTNGDAQTGTQIHAQAKDWYLMCNEAAPPQGQRCALSTPQMIEGQTEPQFSLSIVLTSLKKTPLVYLQTPHDLLIPKGADIKIDGSHLGKLSFRSCHQSGCLVPFSMTPGIRKRLLRGGKAQFEFSTLDGSKLSADFSLFGLTKSLSTASDLMSEFSSGS